MQMIHSDKPISQQALDDGSELKNSIERQISLINFMRMQFVSLLVVGFSFFVLAIDFFFPEVWDASDLFLFRILDIALAIISLTAIVFFWIIKIKKTYYRKIITLVFSFAVMIWAAVFSGLEFLSPNGYVTFIIVLLVSVYFQYLNRTQTLLFYFSSLIVLCVSIAFYQQFTLDVLQLLLSLLPITVISYFVSRRNYEAKVNEIINKQEIIDLNTELEDAKENLEQKIEKRTQELQAAKQQLEENEQMLNQSERIAKQGSFSFSLDTGRMVWSENLYQVYQRNPHLGTPDFEWFRTVLSEKAWLRLNRVIEKSIEQKKGYTFETEIVTHSGDKRYLRTVANPNFDVKRNLTGFTGFTKDITKQRETEKAYKESERRFEAIFKQDKSVKLLIDPGTGIIQDANQAAAGFYNYSINDLIGQNICDINILPEKEVINEMRKATDLQQNNFYFTHQTAKGECKEVEVYSTPVNYGNKTMLFSLIHDVTDRKKAEKLLMESEKKFRTIFNMSLDLMCIADINTTHFKVINPAFTKILGYTEKELINKPFIRFIHPDDVSKTFEIIEKKLKTGAVVIHFTNRYRCKDGSYRWLDWNSHPVPEQGITYAIAHDVTEKVKAEEALKRNEKRLRELNATKDKLFSIISHDFKNPLNNIIGFAELINQKYERYSPGKIKELNTLIFRSASALSELLDNLLIWSRSQRQMIDFYPQKLCLSEIINSCFDLLKPAALSKNIRLQHQIKKETLIFADKEMITIVVRNLLTNAIKFSYNHRKIDVHVQSNERYAVVGITDQGIGMDRKIAERILEHNEAHSSAGTDGERGTGLGLIICKEFIEIHNGKLWVESEISKGSTFYFSLPVSTN